MITILRCGHDSHHSRPVEMEHRHGLDHYLLLLIKTEGYVEQKGQVLTAFPESAVLFQKNTPIRYGCRLDHYNDDWIHFSLSADEKILIETGIPFGAPFGCAEGSETTGSVGGDGAFELIAHRAEFLESFAKLRGFDLVARLVEV